MSIQIPQDSRIYVEVALKPAQGSRFQPTGFPDLGAAEFQTPGGQRVVLVESAQSVANRLELACWDEARKDVAQPLAGLPYVVAKHDDGTFLTSSIQEAHRLNSPYFLESKDTSFMDMLRDELGALESGHVDLGKLAQVLLRLDPNSLLHGIFLAKKDLAGGRLRLPRMISGFIEATEVDTATSGGVKKDDADPTGQKLGTGAKDGFGHVPFSRTEYTGNLKAYFAIDLAQLRAYALGDSAEQLLFALAWFKIHRFLRDGLRLRTACDLEIDPQAGGMRVQRPEGYAPPTLEAVESALPGLIRACGSAFANPSVTVVTYRKK